LESRSPETLQLLVQRVLDNRGALDPALRRHVANGDPPEEARDYVSKVRGRAYTVTEGDVATLLTCGYTEDQVFEMTVAAALGAGLTRLRAGLAIGGAHDAALDSRQSTPAAEPAVPPAGAPTKR
jgi:hypothetical protein